jgi:TonB family protein
MLIVEGYEAATPERGASDSPLKDRPLLDSITNRWRPGQRRMSVVGFYRTCGREGVTLNSDDLAALSASGVATDSDACGRSNSGLGELQRTVKHAEPPPALGTAEDVTGSQAATVASSSPVAESERLFLLMEPHVGRGSQGSLYLAKGGTILCQSPRMPFSRAELSGRAIVGQPPSSGMEDLSVPKEEAGAALHERSLRVETEKEPGMTRSRRWLLVSAAAILCVGFFEVRGQQIRYSLLSNGGAPSDSQLELKTERRGTDWELSWNQRAAILLRAEKGRLQIRDGFVHKNIDLDSSELRNGRIIYTPMSDNVVVELEVETAKSEELVSESVRIVAGVLPPLSGLQAHSANTSRGPRNELRRPAWSGAPQAAGAAGASDKRPNQLLPSVATAVPAGAAKPEAHVKPWISPHPKPVAATVNSAEDQQPLSVPPDVGASPAPSAPELLSAFIPGSTRKSGDAEPAQLILRRDPIYPPAAKRRNISGAVEVQFRINAKGEVYDLAAIKGAPVLTQAAIEAIREWRYKPARLNGVPTDVQAKTVVNFKRD